MTARGSSSAPHRDFYLDTLRAVALVRVVAYHTFGFAGLTLLYPSMGVMFAVAGSLMAQSAARSSIRAIRSRIRRLLPAFWLLALFVVPAMLWHGWSSGDDRPLRWWELTLWIFPILDPPSNDWALQVTGVLWYVRAYLVFVLLSPMALRAFRRWPLATLLTPLILIGVAEIGVLDLYGLGLIGAALADLGIFGACWVLGFAHRAGFLAELSRSAALGLAAGVAMLGAAWTLMHPDPDLGYDLGEIPLGQALWSLGIVLALLRFSPNLDWLASTPVLGRTVRVLNARAVTVYLWHEVALVFSVPVNDRLERYSKLEQFATTWALIGVAILLFGWIEDLAARRRPQLVPGGRQGPVRKLTTAPP